MKELILKYKQFILYAIVGVINTLVDLGVYSLVLFLSGIPTLSQIVGYASGILCSFCLNRGVTFKEENGGSPLLQFLRFLLVNGVTLGISVLGIRFLTEHWTMSGYLAKLPITVVTFVVNYLGYKILVFRKPGHEKGADMDE